MNETVYAFAGLRFEPADGRLSSADGAVGTQLRPQVARLLLAFLARPRTLIDREQLCRAVWDEGTVVDFEAGLAAVLRELRSELKSLGAADDLIETVPRRGYRLNAAVERPSPTAGFSPAGRKRLFGLAAALVVLVLAGLFALHQGPSPPPPADAGRTLAVLPFTQFGEPAGETRRLDLLLADQMLVQLWEVQPEGIVLIGRASIAAFDGRDDLAAAVAANLGIDLLIEGSIAFDAGRVTISARLLEMPAGRIVWSQQLDYAEEEWPSVPAVARRLVEAMVAFMAPRLPASAAGLDPES